MSRKGADKKKFILQKKASDKLSTSKRGGGDDDTHPRPKRDDDLNAWLKSRKLQKPDDQLDLTEAELAEEITKVLSVTNENVIRNLVVFNYKEQCFRRIPLPPSTIEVMNLEGTALNIDSEEGRRQIAEGDVGYPLPPPKYASEHDERKHQDKPERQRKKIVIKRHPSESHEEGEGEEEEEGEEFGDEEEEERNEEGEHIAEEIDYGEDEEEGDEEGEAEVTQTAPPPKKRKLINQFNFCERATLAYVPPRRNIDTTTMPPPRSVFGATIQQWIIYDSYIKDFALHKDKKDERKHRVGKSKGARRHETDELNDKYLQCWRILERMINQNLALDIANDYRFYEDPADEYRVEGTLLPLWKFSYEPTKKLTITEIMFSPKYYDLFAVCYGNFDFMKQTNEGGLCLFTIKNPLYPDYIIMTETGVMCCDIHPKYPFLVAVGLYDGNVRVYNIRNTEYETPMYVSKGINQKHLSVVWQLRWGPDMMDGEINFYTVSSDGRVFNWILMQHTLTVTNIITTYLVDCIVAGPDGTEIKLLSSGHCMRFHPNNPEIFLVGSDEGYIYKCCINNSSRYIMKYTAHNMSVYQIDFNRYNSNIFISCSEDWRVKIWEDMRPDPLFIFDLGSAVGDVKWAPYSSTVFAAITSIGKVYVYDLNVNKYAPICVQLVVPRRRNKLTTLAFNEKLPFLIVGDIKGTITSLKLSPNLRIMVKPPKKQLYLSQHVLQVQKLDRLLTLMRETDEVQPPAAVPAQAPAQT